MSDGIQVIVLASNRLLVALPGGRFHARFLFLPASIAPGDIVWLRIERELNEATETRAPVDVNARVIDVLGPQCAPLQPGMRFLITIDHFDAPCASTEETRSRFVFLEDEGPTEKQWQPWDDATIRDAISTRSS